jgi:exonuclease I
LASQSFGSSHLYSSNRTPPPERSRL